MIRVIEYMMSAKDQDVFVAKKICKKARVPEFYTRKGLQVLSRLGVIKSIKGPGGGYQIAGAASQFSVLEIIQAVDGKNTYSHCVMGLSKCAESKPCLIHEVWSQSKMKILNDLSHVSLQDLAGGSEQKKITDLVKK